MSWIDRIREAAYTSPGETRTVFAYEDVSREVDKKTTAFDFPDANGTYVQDLGHTGRRFPLRVIFYGENHDTDADAFELTLLEIGTGILEHPRYGTIDVVPFGSIKQRDDLKTAANQTIIELEFWQTIGLVYPTATVAPASAVIAAVEEYNTATAESFEAALDLDSALDAVTFKNEYLAVLDGATVALQAIADTTDAVRQRFDAINASINNSIDLLIAQPLTLAFQTVQLIQAPALAVAAISARLEAYRNLADSLIAGDDATYNVGEDNAFQTADLYASTYVSAAVLSTVNTQFDTKRDAIDAADFLLELFGDVAAWRDNSYNDLGAIDTGQSYQQLQEAIAVAAGFLVEISFSLKQERRIVLTSPRTIIDLTAELYGAVDSELDFFITSNDLSGSEILEIPKGREIVYYI